jgi:hypothetical protein
MRIRSLTILVAMAPLFACGDDSAETTQDAGPNADTGADVRNDSAGDGSGATAPTYHGAVRGLLEENCVSCHATERIAPFVLDTAESAIANGPAAVAAVESGRMPPWPASDDCHPLIGSRRLEPTEVATLRAWADGGYLVGDPSEYVAPQLPPDDLGPPTIEIRPDEAYVANPAQPDDYRCLPIAHEFTEDTWVTATQVLPDQDAIVHHVLLYLIGPDYIEDLEALDAGNDGLGFTCFGAVGVGAEELLAAWAPGQQALRMPPDSAVPVPAGARIVMQVHYNLLGYSEGELPPADRSTAQLWTLPAGETPAHRIHMLEFIDWTFNVPAGETHTATRELGVALNGDIVGVAPHQHMLGQQISLTAISEDGDETCLVDVPDWDFNWQMFYRFSDDNVVPITTNDRIRLSCTWDNSPENQPIVNGVRQEPREVRWGDGTLDEMCYSVLLVSTPVYEGNEGTCRGFSACVDTCDSLDGPCLVNCSLSQGAECFGCLLGASEDCAISNCAVQAVPFERCNGRCEDVFGCFTADCEAEFDALVECLAPEIQGGDCVGAWDACLTP